jgi:16S rRNA G966 N2-methylase RsmD
VQRVWLLVSPLARGAYFDAVHDVAVRELHAYFPDSKVTIETRGPLSFLVTDVPLDASRQLARLSFVQAVMTEKGERFSIVDQLADFNLPESLVTGTKYAGKTNELLTQFAINLGLAFLEPDGQTPLRLLDPMAGRGTTLLWALRYDMDAVGIEIDKRALAGFQQHVKKQTKLQRIKHRQTTGFIGKSNRGDDGRYIQYEFGDRQVRLVIGDAREPRRLTQQRPFHLIISDLPYGVAHSAVGGVMDTLSQCAGQWARCLRKGGIMVLAFNQYQSPREAIIDCFGAHGLVAKDISAPHRMSESIVRDLLVMGRPAGPTESLEARPVGGASSTVLR